MINQTFEVTLHYRRTSWNYCYGALSYTNVSAAKN